MAAAEPEEQVVLQLFLQVVTADLDQVRPLSIAQHVLEVVVDVHILHPQVEDLVVLAVAEQVHLTINQVQIVNPVQQILVVAEAQAEDPQDPIPLNTVGMVAQE